MIVEYFEQGSDEWHAARVGIHTASQWDSLITPTGKASTGAGPETYLNRLISECLTGEREKIPDTYWMRRGVQMEDEARETAEAMLGIDFEQVGIVYQDDNRQIACSPDGIELDMSIGIEIKCPAPATHVGYVRDNKCPKKYYHQVQGSMLVTGFDSWYFMSYHPVIKPLLIEVKRDEAYIKTLQDVLNKQVEIKLKEVERLGV